MGMGSFITLEGGEGAGKSTCMEAAVQVLTGQGIEVLQTREPGGTRLSESLRDLLLNPDIGTISDKAELLMVFAARAQHLEEKINPALAAGTWVVCDRFTDASFAYQGAGRGLPEPPINWLEQWVHGSVQPDLTLLLDVPPEIGLERATRGRDADRFETETLAFYKRVRQAYLQRANQSPDRFRIVDASQPLDAVVADVRARLSEFLGARAA